MRLRGTEAGFDRWVAIVELLSDLIEVPCDSLWSPADLRFWLPYLTDLQVAIAIVAGGYGALLHCESADPFDVLTDMIDSLRFEAGLSGYYGGCDE